MGKRRLIVASAVVLVVLAVFTPVLLRLREPVYRGRGLTDWLGQYTTNRPFVSFEAKLEAGNAIRQLGPAAAPYCVTMISSRPSETIDYILTRIPPVWLVRLHLPSTNVYEQQLRDRRHLGEAGLILLDTNAQKVVPRVIKLLDNHNPEVRHSAIFVLAELGTEARAALPGLLKCVNDSEPLVRFDAVWALGNLHADAPRVVPVLADIAKNRALAQTLRQQAMTSLGEFQSGGVSAMPVLLSCLEEGNPETRVAASNAIWQINRETVARTTK